MGWLVLAAIAWTVVCLLAGIAVGARIGKLQAGWYDTAPTHGVDSFDVPPAEGYDGPIMSPFPPSVSVTPPPLESDLMHCLETISGAVDDAVAGRPVEDVIGEIGLAIDTAISLLKERRS